MKVVLIPGDGIGKEISESVKKVSDALETNIEWDIYSAGAEYYEECGKLFEDGLLEAIKENKIALKGPTATPIGTGFRSINVQLRQHFSTYANLRPVHSLEGVPSRYENVDLVIVRENTEDLYKGIEYMYDQDTAHGIKLITRQASERIIRYSFEYARKNHRKKVTCVHKANIMKLTDGLFLDVFKEVAKDYSDIESDSVIIDALCMKLVTDPTKFDVLVAPNLYGDIISDLCAGLVGGLGFAPSANIGNDVVIYEAVHGSAPDIAGQNKANPTSLLLSFAMLLKDNGMEDKAKKLEEAIYGTIKEGIHTTSDIGGKEGCIEFTDALCKRMKQ
jgi:isocitrate dehydrogenase (NAD+)